MIVLFNLAAHVFIGVLFLINFLTTPGDWWALYPAGLLLLSSLSIMLDRKLGYKLYAFTMATGFIVYLSFVNWVQTPDYPWILYICFPLLWWPLSAFFGQASRSLFFAGIASSSMILYYILLNMFWETGFPWAIFPAFILLWWPLSIGVARRPLAYGVLGTLLSSVFFIAVNWITTPEAIWAIYPIFALIWWPMSIALYKKPFAFSLAGSALLIVFFVAVNVLTTPLTPWAVFVIFAVLWWPLAMYVYWHKQKKRHSF
ncbi:hypothetical protein Q5W88_13870 [Shouchella clausii]|uniref:hypothetical protein n=1 Tax=Shouchella clausii TaxID=79880 RepID=UPI0026F41407|nr:hypothetical protein [Shouchella clausii]MDO7284211.1 hypothetical protein [Shouchella clausii]MDO7304306.1 hypothetical protein [Shouchella clausii]